MIEYRIIDNGILFAAANDGENYGFNDWVNTDDCIYYFPLMTLADNGFATVENDGCFVPFENIYQLDEDERSLLGLPNAYNKAMRLRGIGLLNDSEFHYQLDYLSHVPDGELLNAKRQGNIITIDNVSYLLSAEQFNLANLVEDFNSQDQSTKTTDYNLRGFDEIKALAQKANCELDSYLENENVVIPEKIKIEIGHEENGFTIQPAINDDGNEGFQKAYDKLRKVPAVYPVSNEAGERKRVVLSPTQKENLSSLKSRGKYQSREEIQNLVENPTELFDPDEFDLSEFYSDRVIEIGVYKPKFYPFISPYKSCWVAGATIETPENGTSRIEIKTQEDLDHLDRLIQEAESSHQAVVEFNDTTLDIGDAKFLSEISHKQLAAPDKPIDVKKEGIKRKVLIIEDNAETLGYKAKQQLIEQGGHYTLYVNPFLDKKYSLKTHQREGVAWLQHLYSQNAVGCLMADDMGLGKTLQILYFIDWHSREHKDHKPYLIVAPVSLLENWQNEYEKFIMAPRLGVKIVTSRDIPRHFDKEAISMMQNADILLTNYESLRTSQLNFCAVDFNIIVLDEAQKIKSPGTMVTNAAKALKGKFKIAMTGTPVENSLLDLWCIMDYCVPGLLGNARAFARKYQSPLKNLDVDIQQMGEEVHDQLGVYFIRRLKSDVAKDLPNKIERKEPEQMPPFQEQTYQDEIKKYYLDSQNHNMLLTIMKIREISEHPFLYDGTIHEHSDIELIDNSARLITTVKILDQIKSRNEKVIVFAERKEIQRMLQQLFRDRYGLNTTVINGDSPTHIAANSRSHKESRQASIDRFQAVDGFNIIIMSPIAAGMGLNVTAANNVIHYSRHWNPAKENQATDRAYRIGQEKDVYVYYPLAVSDKFKSFDLTLDELLSRKTTLATSTIFPTERIEVKQEELFQMMFNE